MVTCPHLFGNPLIVFSSVLFVEGHSRPHGLEVETREARPSGKSLGGCGPQSTVGSPSLSLFPFLVLRQVAGSTLCSHHDVPS